jgi:lipopolysaccharide/colanic/teichoic acid biosynthesis glycosyltransferase
VPVLTALTVLAKAGPRVAITSRQPTINGYKELQMALALNQNFQANIDDKRKSSRSSLDESVVNLSETTQVLAVPIKVKNFSYELTKRVLDIVMAATALIVLAPLLAIIGVLVGLTSSGPIFFAQVRVGAGGKLFKMYKFRTMFANAEQLKKAILDKNEVSGPVFKMKNDPRITRVGAILRRYSLDELPQLWNVLRGEMSVVGPRPALLDEVKKYKNWQLQRLQVSPGLTCIWQVSGRSNIKFEDWMRLDINYIENRKHTLDVVLIAKTFKAIVSGDGAY